MASVYAAVVQVLGFTAHEEEYMEVTNTLVSRLRQYPDPLASLVASVSWISSIHPDPPR